MSDPDMLVFTVELESGDFKSVLRVPLTDNPKTAVEKWLDLIATGLRVGAQDFTARIGTEAGWQEAIERAAETADRMGNHYAADAIRAIPEPEGKR